MTEALAAKVATFSSSTSDWDITTALNAPDSQLPTKRVKVSVSSIRAIYMSYGFWGTIVRIAGDPSKPDNLRDLCITTRDTCTLLSQIDTDDEAVYSFAVQAIDALLGAGLINQAAHDALIALSVAHSSWAEINNNGLPVRSQDVEEARRK